MTASDDFSPLAPDRFKRCERAWSPGPAPMLQWIEVHHLRIDARYQRAIRGAGAKNVQAIAEAFSWSKFAPLIVAPIAGGLFAVIDGQHRATAAALRGVSALPAQVVIADEIEQAAAFKAINSQTTRMHGLELHRAALAAGDEAALRLSAICTRAGVTICPHPRAAGRLKPGETLAIGALTSQVKRLDEDLLVTSLKCVTQSTNNKPGVLSALVIDALCAAVPPAPAWRIAGERLYRAFDAINIQREEDKAKFTPRDKGVGTWEILADRLTERLSKFMGAA